MQPRAGDPDSPNPGRVAPFNTTKYMTKPMSQGSYLREPKYLSELARAITTDGALPDLPLISVDEDEGEGAAIEEEHAQELSRTIAGMPMQEYGSTPLPYSGSPISPVSPGVSFPSMGTTPPSHHSGTPLHLQRRRSHAASPAVSMRSPSVGVSVADFMQNWSPAPARADCT